MLRRRSPAALAWLLAAGMCAAGAASAPGPARAQKPPPVSATSLERKIHDLVNRERRAQNIKPLAWDARLAAVARGHSGDMAKRDYFSHQSPEGEGFDGRYSRARYRCALRTGDTVHAGAENIARGNLYASVTTRNGVQYFDWNSESRIARTTTEGWMASPGHRANILAPHWKHEGIGVVIAPDRRVYITQNFC